jgi:hypothetical protein
VISKNRIRDLIGNRQRVIILLVIGIILSYESGFAGAKIPNSESILFAAVNSISDSAKNTVVANSNNIHYIESPAATFAIAFIPGFFVHGLGHYYIGDNRKGNVILATEGVSILLFLTGAAAGLTNTFANDDNPDPEPYLIDDILAYSGGALFLGSWAYDFIDAPKQAKKMAQEYPRKVLITPTISKHRFAVELSLRF